MIIALNQILLIFDGHSNQNVICHLALNGTKWVTEGLVEGIITVSLCKADI